MNARQWKLYQALVENPPAHTRDAIGRAYWHGYHHPVMPVGEIEVGPAGSLTRAAFKAGQSNSRQIR